MKEPIQESTDLRMLAAFFPRCDNPATVTEHVQTCLHDVTIRAAKRLEAAEDALYHSEQYIEHLHSVLGIQDTPRAAVMEMDPEDLRRRWKNVQSLHQPGLDGSDTEKVEPAQLHGPYSTEDLLETVAAARNAFECLCHSIFSVFNKGAE